MEQSRQHVYWCFICEKEFKTNEEAQACTFCSNTAFEAINMSHQENEPSSFQVYQIPSPSPVPQINNIPPPPIFNNLFQPNFVQTLQFAPGLTVQSLSMALPQINNLNNTIINTFNQIQQMFVPGGGIANLINSLLGQNNLTPASAQQINRLQKIDQVPQCSICQEQNDKIENIEQRKGVKLNCGHMFHHHCIGPWFQRTNTCPYCRVRI